MSDTILQWIMKRSPCFNPIGTWDFLTPVAGVRTLPFADPAVMEELRQEFTSDQLEAARVMVRNGDQLELNSVLAGESVRGLFLRRTKNEAPFDIVNQNGSLTTDVPPSFGCIQDYFTKCFSGEAKSILVACSDEDLGVLRMLSLPCTPAAGLATMNGRQLRGLFADASAFSNNASDQKHAVSVVSEDYRLVLSGWHVAELKNQPPGVVTSVVSRLLKAEDAFGFDTSGRVGIWQPTAKEFSRIRSAAELQDRALIRKLVWRSVDRSTHSARQFMEGAASRSPMDYSAARKELLDTIARARELGLQSSDIAKRLESFNRSFDASVVDAIIRDAMSATDSFDRSLLLAAAELMGYWHKSSSLVRGTQDGANGRSHLQEETLHPEELKERLRVIDGLVKIHRELTRNK